MSDYIASPRPIFHEVEEKDTTLVIGGITSGIVVRITKKGLEINGYYAGLTDRVKFANIRKFALISWEDLNKMKVEASEGRKKKTTPKKRNAVVGSLSKIHTYDAVLQSHRVDKPKEEYLKKLPIVTLNGEKYYMDMERKERRPVKNPEKVYSFEGLSTKKPK